MAWDFRLKLREKFDPPQYIFDSVSSLIFNLLNEKRNNISNIQFNEQLKPTIQMRSSTKRKRALQMFNQNETKN